MSKFVKLVLISAGLLFSVSAFSANNTLKFEIKNHIGTDIVVHYEECYDPDGHGEEDVCVSDNSLSIPSGKKGIISIKRPSNISNKLYYGIMIGDLDIKNADTQHLGYSVYKVGKFKGCTLEIFTLYLDNGDLEADEEDGNCFG